MDDRGIAQLFAPDDRHMLLDHNAQRLLMRPLLGDHISVAPVLSRYDPKDQNKDHIRRIETVRHSAL